MNSTAHIKIYLLFAALLLSGTGSAQAYYQLSSKSKKALKWYHRSEDAFKHRDNEDALFYLNKAIDKDARFIEAWLLKGDILSEMKRPQLAIGAYEKAVEIDPDFFSQAWFFLGNLYYEVGAYDNSVKAFKRFLSVESISATRRKLGEKKLLLSKAARQLVESPVDVQVVALDSLINTSADEYINFVNSANRKLIFTRKEKERMPASGEHSAAFLEKLYFTEKNSTDWVEPQLLDISWAKNLNIGGLSFSVDGEEMYFTGCGWPGSFGGCDLYKSSRVENSWQEPVNLGSSVNSSAWESQPYVSSDGKLLFFSSSRAGGHGGSDIWMAVKLKNGKWSPPVNMGDSINTTGNEMAPFLYADNRTLVFSSNGWPGMGKQDVFISRRSSAGVWGKAENIGFPANSRFEDINMIYSLDGHQAWISSNRDSGSFDIYQLPVFDKIKPKEILFFTGKVRNNSNRKPIMAQVILTDGTTGLTVESKYSRRSDGYFLMVLEPDKEYAFNIEAAGYMLYSERFSPGKTNKEINHLNKEFLLTPIAHGNSVVLRNLYFDVDDWKLKSSSFPELNKLVDFLNMNPDIKLEIEGHTDNTGDAAYNKKLSKIRAKAVYDYLVDKKISSGRLRYVGYGNSRPVADNFTPEGKAKNRRVVIVVQ